ncbi:hypothetical protein HGRIS_003158 [Hohenbuehelia grisea]|uniref:GED domain-containing protein n=1 Tax=Hohenbuehelia grisea TaxID=104357 RepID=A0ABR3JNM1_9AGAR
MLCSLHSVADSWYCTISLQKRFDSAGNKLAVYQSETFAPHITDKAEVDLWIRRAQAAILSAHRSADVFQNASAGDLQNIMQTDPEVSMFSKNVICIDIYDPEATDLSFMDLPGLVLNDEPETIALVYSLVSGEIRTPNTIILTAIPMTDDMKNQQAVQLARDADPDGERTIGVLTKVDMLTQGSTTLIQTYKDLLMGHSDEDRLKHGYYCVRLSDDQQRSRGISRGESKDFEEKFFRQTAPWNSENMDSKRLGVANLVSNLGSLLVDLIEKSLPGLQEQALNKYRQSAADLLALPPRISNNPLAETLLRTSKFCEDFTRMIQGECRKEYVQTNRLRYKQFRQDIRNTAPRFRPLSRADKDPEILFHAAEDGDAGFKGERDVIDLDHVRQRIADARGWELDGHVPFKPTKDLIKLSIVDWRLPMIQCFESVGQTFHQYTDSLLDHHFGQFKGLREYVRRLVMIDMELAEKKSLEMLDICLEMEDEPIFTQNDHDFHSLQTKWLEIYRHAFETRRYSPSATLEEVPGFIPARYGLPVPVAPSQPIRSGRDPEIYRHELIVMADVRAYFQIAYKRYIDVVPLAIEKNLHRNLASKLNASLIGSLVTDPNTTEHLAVLLAEDPIVSRRRLDLEQRKKGLEKVLEKLDQFVGSQ